MQNRSTWIAFLIVCFALTGMVGLFASYATSIPLERGLHRLASLEAAAGAGEAEAVRSVLGPDAASHLNPPNSLVAARAQIQSEASAEADAVAYRTRLMLVVMTVMSGAVGVGLLLLASRKA